VISEPERVELSKEPESIVHVTLPPGRQGERDYEGAADTLARWIRDGVLECDSDERLYVLEERVPDGRVRRGLVGLVRLASYDERVVLPHERTMAGPKRDRLLLTRAVKANLEPLFMLYEDRDAKLTSLLEAAVQGTIIASCLGPDGTELRFGAIDDPAQIEAVQAHLADRPVIIADGHHRYETMVAYRDECREAARKAGREPGPDDPHEFVMAYLVNAFDPGSRIRAIHRVIEGEIGDLRAVLTKAGFQMDERDAAESPESLLETLRARREQQHGYVFVGPDGLRILASRPRGDTLDVEVLHEELLPEIGGKLSFDSRPHRLLDRIERGEVTLGILLDALDPDSLFRVVQAGAVLPQKSTFFSPKIPSGLVLRGFN
jgi:uncharacterized protein (DUF1015 family)